MKKFICLLLILTTSFSLFACDDSSNDHHEEQEEKQEEKQETKTESWSSSLLKSDPSGVQYDYYFKSVEDMYDAIKRDPDKYNGKSVKVIGTLYKVPGSSDISLLDYTVTSAAFKSEDNYSPVRIVLDMVSRYNSFEKIDVSITSDTQYAVIETGDLVKLYGTIVIDRSGIQFENCEYKLIATLEERIEKVK